MKSHILLPSKVQDSRKEASKELSKNKTKKPVKEIKKKKSFCRKDKPLARVSVPEAGDQSPVFEIANRASEVIEFSKAIEDFNKDLIDDEKIDNIREDMDNFLLHPNTDILREELKAEYQHMFEDINQFLDEQKIEEQKISSKFPLFYKV